MASYSAARVGDSIVITMPLSAIVKSVEGNPDRLAVDRAEVVDIDALAAEIVESINASNAVEALVECEVGVAVSCGSKAVVTKVAGVRKRA